MGADGKEAKQNIKTLLKINLGPLGNLTYEQKIQARNSELSGDGEVNLTLRIIVLQ